MGKAGDGVDVAPVTWAAVGVSVRRSGEDGGEDAELRAGISNCPVAWTAIGSGEGHLDEVGSKEMELGACAGEEWSWVPHVGVGGRCV